MRGTTRAPVERAASFANARGKGSQTCEESSRITGQTKSGLTERDLAKRTGEKESKITAYAADISPARAEAKAG